MPASLSSIDRPLELRLRPDLQVAPVEMSGRTTWVVKDPLTLEHFQFSAEEYALMNWMREPVSIAELRRSFGREFPPQQITPEVIWEFLSRLHSSGLVISDAVGQDKELLDRKRREQGRRWSLAWTGLLCMRFRGIDPDRFLTAIHREFRWLFLPATFVALAAIVLFALSLIVGHFDEFRGRLPELSALFDSRNLPWLLLAIGGVKVLHELGHALTCKHFGGEVHEMGIMLLVFAPCLYCDVSDAWRFTNKWRRIAVSAAGMGVELVLASVATIIWWFAQPGVVQLVALNVMIICTVNTLLVNGNPLMRYDGYFVLCDLLESPNLWQRSREVLHRIWSHWLTGRWTAPDPLVPARRRAWLAAYGALSKLYMVVICITIVWGLAKVLHPLHLQNLAFAVGLTIFAGALVRPVSSAVQLVRSPVRRAELRKGRAGIVTALVLAAAVGILSIPVTYHVHAPLVLMPDDAARVYASIEGTLTKTLPAGQTVSKGQTIGLLESTDTELELARLEGEQRERQLRIDHLQRLRGLDREANDQLPAAQAALADSNRRLDERRNEATRLKLTSPADGVVIPAPRVSAKSEMDGRLASWSGSLLDESARGARVEPGTLVCLVGDPTRLTAMLLVNDTDVKRLQPGQTARLRIDQLPGQIVEGTVIDVARHDARKVENETAGRASLSPLLAGIMPPGRSGALYEARVRFSLESRDAERGVRSEERDSKSLTSSPLAPRSSLLIIGGRGDAKITAERLTLARLIVRYLSQTFRLPM